MDANFRNYAVNALKEALTDDCMNLKNDNFNNISLEVTTQSKKLDF